MSPADLSFGFSSQGRHSECSRSLESGPGSSKGVDPRIGFHFRSQLAEEGRGNQGLPNAAFKQIVLPAPMCLFGNCYCYGELQQGYSLNRIKTGLTSRKSVGRPVLGRPVSSSC